MKRVTRVTLTRTTEPTRSDHTSYPGTELWRVEWTELRNGKPNALRQSHYTEAAARRHVDGLLRMRASRDSSNAASDFLRSGLGSPDAPVAQAGGLLRWRSQDNSVKVRR